MGQLGARLRFGKPRRRPGAEAPSGKGRGSGQWVKSGVSHRVRHVAVIFDEAVEIRTIRYYLLVSSRPPRKRNTSMLKSSAHAHIGLCPAFGSTINCASIMLSAMSRPRASGVM